MRFFNSEWRRRHSERRAPRHQILPRQRLRNGRAEFDHFRQQRALQLVRGHHKSSPPRGDRDAVRAVYIGDHNLVKPSRRVRAHKLERYRSDRRIRPRRRGSVNRPGDGRNKTDRSIQTIFRRAGAPARRVVVIRCGNVGRHQLTSPGQDGLIHTVHHDEVLARPAILDVLVSPARGLKRMRAVARRDCPRPPGIHAQHVEAARVGYRAAAPRAGGQRDAADRRTALRGRRARNQHSVPSPGGREVQVRKVAIRVGEGPRLGRKLIPRPRGPQHPGRLVRHGQRKGPRSLGRRAELGAIDADGHIGEQTSRDVKHVPRQRRPNGDGRLVRHFAARGRTTDRNRQPRHRQRQADDVRPAGAERVRDSRIASHQVLFSRIGQCPFIDTLGQRIACDTINVAPHGQVGRPVRRLHHEPQVRTGQLGFLNDHVARRAPRLSSVQLRGERAPTGGEHQYRHERQRGHAPHVAAARTVRARVSQTHYGRTPPLGPPHGTLAQLVLSGSWHHGASFHWPLGPRTVPPDKKSPAPYYSDERLSPICPEVLVVCDC